jgi:hypothetical protein
MGSSAPKSETSIKPGKPLLVQDWRPRSQDLGLAEAANYWQERALQARAGRQNTVNQYLAQYGQGPVYSPLTTTEGRTFTPNVVSEPFDASQLVPGESFYKLPERTKEKKDKTPRETYGDAVAAVVPSRPTLPYYTNN